MTEALETRPEHETERPVRHRPSDALPFKCGGVNKNGGYCERVAGWGTDHKKVGRCKNHEDDPNGDGLALWVGEIPDRVYYLLTGSNPNRDPETGQLTASHGARRAIDNPWYKALQEALSEDEYEIMMAAPISYEEVANLQVKWLQMQLIRVERRRQQLRRRLNANVPENTEMTSLELERMGSTALEISNALNRWMSLKAKYQELAQDRDGHEKLREMLKGLTDEEYSRIRRQPSRLAAFGVSTPRFDDEL